ncbi:MAG: hypothetical protein JJT96_12450, partial [Opitutales bacterium]|nr:hypothetical protein [Opitutales bacterium]
MRPFFGVGDILSSQQDVRSAASTEIDNVCLKIWIPAHPSIRRPAVFHMNNRDGAGVASVRSCGPSHHAAVRIPDRPTHAHVFKPLDEAGPSRVASVDRHGVDGSPPALRGSP